MYKRQLFNFGLKSLLELGRMGDIRNNDKHFFFLNNVIRDLFFPSISYLILTFSFSFKKHYFEQFLTASSILRTGKGTKKWLSCVGADPSDCFFN